MLSALKATGKSIIEELDAKGCQESPEGIRESLPAIVDRWTTLKATTGEAIESNAVAVNQFSQFLERFTSFLVWLSEFRSSLFDEVCIQIPTRASDEIIARHKHRLQVRKGGEWRRRRRG